MMEKIQNIISRNYDSAEADAVVAKCLRLAKRAEAYAQTYSEVLAAVAEQRADGAQRFAAAKLLAPLAARLEGEFRETAVEMLAHLNHAQLTNQFAGAAGSVAQKLAKEHPDGARLSDVIRASRKQVEAHFKEQAPWFESLAKAAEGGEVWVKAEGDAVVITRRTEGGQQSRRVWHGTPQSGQLAPMPVESLYGGGGELLFGYVEDGTATDRPVDMYASSIGALALARDRLYQHVRELEEGHLGIFRGAVIPALIAIGLILMAIGAAAFVVGIILNSVGGCSMAGRPPSAICDAASALLLGGLAAAFVGAGLFLAGGAPGFINGVPVNFR